MFSGISGFDDSAMNDPRANHAPPAASARIKNTFEPSMPKKPLNVVGYLDERGIGAELIAVAGRPPLCRSTYACVHGHAIIE